MRELFFLSSSNMPSNQSNVSPGTAVNIFQSFGALAVAFATRELLQTIFFLSLARHDRQLFGVFMLAEAAGIVLASFIDGGMSQYLVISLARRDFSALHRVTALKTVAFAAGWTVMIAMTFLRGLTPPSRAIILVMTAGFGIDAMANSFFAELHVFGRQKVEAAIRIASTTIALGFAIASLFAGASPVLIACFKPMESCLNFAGVGTVTRYHLLPRRGSFSKKSLLETLIAGWPFAFLCIIPLLCNKANYFLLQLIVGLDAVSQYAAAWQIVEGIAGVVGGILILKILFPPMARLWKNNHADFEHVAAYATRWILAFSLVAAFPLMTGGETIVGLLYGPSYGQAASLLKPLAPCLGLALLNSLASVIMLAMNKEKILAIFLLASLATSLILGPFLIAARPFTGSVITIITAQTVLALLCVGFCISKCSLLKGSGILRLFCAAGAGILAYLLARKADFRLLALTSGMLPPLILLAYESRQLRLGVGNVDS